MTSQLMVSRGSRRVTRQQLAALPRPEAIGPRHKPVPHIELIETLEARFKHKLNATVQMEEFAVRANSTLFGVMTLTYGMKNGLLNDTTAAVGLRHANDMSLSLQLVAGMSVFACDNMVLRGDAIIMREKHLLTLNLVDQIDVGIDRFVAQYKTLEGETQMLRDMPLSNPVAKSIILEAFIKEKVMRLNLIERVYDEYFKPTKPEFEPRTGWSLYNAFTQVAKDLPLGLRMTAVQKLGRMLGLAS